MEHPPCPAGWGGKRTACGVESLPKMITKRSVVICFFMRIRWYVIFVKMRGGKMIFVVILKRWREKTMRTIKDYHQGERFVYGKKNCVVLEHMDDGTLCMVLDEDFESAFGGNNNFAESELREKLNCEYLDEWVTNGANRASFVLMQVDLTANDGLKDYGTCECFLAPRTCDQHRKYRYLIPNPKESAEWTVTAYSTNGNGFSDVAYLVTDTGGLGISNVSVNVAYGVRPLFKLNPDTVIFPDPAAVTITLKTDEPQVPRRYEPCEHEFEDLYYADFTMTNNNVWVERADGYKKKALVCCKKCGQVFVKGLEEEGK